MNITVNSVAVIDGKEIFQITVRRQNCFMKLLTFGATLQKLCFPDKNGVLRDICLGYDTVEQYRDEDGYLGAVIGRNANRIGGANIVMDGKTIPVTANEGANQLHGGAKGFSHHVWEYEINGSNGAVTFTRTSPHGEEGFPGTLRAKVTYILDDSGLAIEYKAISDQDTVVNMTNHAYFNLAGHDGGPICDHLLQVNAPCYTVSGEGNIPTGEIASARGTPLDLQAPTLLDERLGHPDLAQTFGLDHNLALGGSETAATLYCPRTGIAMDVVTDCPGVQVYTAGFLIPRAGKDGVTYDRHHGICLETQKFPDAPHHDNFPSTILRRGEVYHTTTKYKIYCK